MGRPAGPVGFNRRLARVRMTFGSRGPWTAPNRFAAELGVSQQRYAGWEKGSFPAGGVEELAGLLARLVTVRELGADPVKVARWAAEGPDDAPPFDEPANPNDAQDPRRTVLQGSTEHRTPALGTNVTSIPIVDPEVAIDRAIEDVEAGRAEPAVAKLRAAKALLAALKAARNAGLAGVLIAGTYGDVQGNAKIFREKIAEWAKGAAP